MFARGQRYQICMLAHVEGSSPINMLALIVMPKFDGLLFSGVNQLLCFLFRQFLTFLEKNFRVRFATAMRQ